MVSSGLHIYTCVDCMGSWVTLFILEIQLWSLTPSLWIVWWVSGLSAKDMAGPLPLAIRLSLDVLTWCAVQGRCGRLREAVGQFPNGGVEKIHGTSP